MPLKLQLRNKSFGRLEANKSIMIKQMLNTVRGLAVTNAPAIQRKAELRMLLKWQGCQFWEDGSVLARKMSQELPATCNTLYSVFYRHYFFSSLFLLVGPSKWAVKTSGRVQEFGPSLVSHSSLKDIELHYSWQSFVPQPLPLTPKRSS